MSSNTNNTAAYDSDDEVYTRQMEEMQQRIRDEEARIENERRGRREAKEAERRRKEEEAERQRREEEKRVRKEELLRVVRERQAAAEEKRLEEERQRKVEDARAKAKKRKAGPESLEGGWLEMNLLELPSILKRKRSAPQETRAEKDAREARQSAAIGGRRPCVRCLQYGHECRAQNLT